MKRLTELYDKVFKEYNPFPIIDNIKSAKSIKFLPRKNVTYNAGVIKSRVGKAVQYTVIIDGYKMFFITKSQKAILFVKEPDTTKMFLNSKFDKKYYDYLMKITNQLTRMRIAKW